MFGTSYNKDRYHSGYPPHKEHVIREWFYDRVRWEYKFCIIPRKCMLTDKWLWLTYAYRGIASMRAGDNDFIFEKGYHQRDAHIIWELRK